VKIGEFSPFSLFFTKNAKSLLLGLLQVLLDFEKTDFTEFQHFHVSFMLFSHKFRKNDENSSKIIIFRPKPEIML